jgi:hypothetical protein
MMPEEPVYSLMRRTMDNLRFIERCATRGGPYEVTHLVNSFLGALAHPWEELRIELNQLELRESQKRGWPHVTKELPTDKEPASLGDMISLVRHSFAHGHIEFLPDEGGEIAAVRFWNVKPGTDKRTWGSVLGVDELRRFLECFVTLAEEINKEAQEKRM